MKNDNSDFNPHDMSDFKDMTEDEIIEANRKEIERIQTE